MLAQKKTSFLAYAQLATNRMARIKNKHSQDENQARSSEFELVWFPFKNTLIDLLNHSQLCFYALVLIGCFICYNYYYCLYWLVSWNPANVLEVFKPASMEKENAQVVFSLEHNLMVYEALKQEVSARVGVGAEAGAGDASNQL